jgi:hypothetical protein
VEAGNRVRKWILALAAIAFATLALPFLWRNYAFPGATMETDYARCAVEADRLYGVQRVQWRSENRFGLNPFDEAADQYNKRCMIAAGWLYRMDDPDPVGCGVWCYVPRGPFAQWLFDRRYY